MAVFIYQSRSFWNFGDWWENRHGQVLHRYSHSLVHPSQPSFSPQLQCFGGRVLPGRSSVLLSLASHPGPEFSANGHLVFFLPGLGFVQFRGAEFLLGLCMTARLLSCSSVSNTKRRKIPPITMKSFIPFLDKWSFWVDVLCHTLYFPVMGHVVSGGRKRTGGVLEAFGQNLEEFCCSFIFSCQASCHPSCVCTSAPSSERRHPFSLLQSAKNGCWAPLSLHRLQLSRLAVLLSELNFEMDLGSGSGKGSHTMASWCECGPPAPAPRPL